MYVASKGTIKGDTYIIITDTNLPSTETYDNCRKAMFSISLSRSNAGSLFTL